MLEYSMSSSLIALFEKFQKNLEIVRKDKESLILENDRINLYLSHYIKMCDEYRALVDVLKIRIKELENVEHNESSIRLPATFLQ